mmetsp:Transcript_44192/g.44735  ORF Transcript_44192/g.44735 Transcript_44192/m.44735 type:complete len:120 (-) Transcript_44192:1433-1792(-)
MFVVATRSFRYDDTIKENIDVNVVENLRSSQEYIQNEIATCLYEQKNLKMQLLSLSVSQDHLPFSSNSCASPSKLLRTPHNIQRNSCKRCLRKLIPAHSNAQKRTSVVSTNWDTILVKR